MPLKCILLAILLYPTFAWGQAPLADQEPTASSAEIPELKRSVDSRGLSRLTESLMIGGGGCLCSCVGLSASLLAIRALNEGRPHSARQLWWSVGTYLGITLGTSFVMGLGAALFNPPQNSEELTFVAVNIVFASGFFASFIGGGAAGLAWYLADPDKSGEGRAEAKVLHFSAPHLAMVY